MNDRHAHDNYEKGTTYEVEIGDEIVTYETRFCSQCGQQQNNVIVSRRKKGK